MRRFIDIPFVQAYFQSGRQRPKAIEVRASFTPARSGAALSIANMNHRNNGDARPPHYIVDETNTYQCISDDVVSGVDDWSIKGLVGVMVCSEPMGDVEYWDDLTHAKVLSRTAQLIARLCHTYKIPAAYLSVEGQERWKKTKWFRSRGGIIIDVRGAWPYKEFMADVKTHLAYLK